MIGWLASFLLFIAGSIASLFLPPDALNFDVVSMVIAVLLFTIVVLIIAFRAYLAAWFKRVSGKNKQL